MVSLATGLELVRVMLREQGAWCRLEVEGVFAAHVGWDQYVYVSTGAPGERALALTRELGLFPEAVDASPYVMERDEGEIQRRATTCSGRLVDEESFAELTARLCRTRTASSAHAGAPTRLPTTARGPSSPRCDAGRS
ncbi:hypothetical protein [Streptomyces zhihengii]